MGFVMCTVVQDSDEGDAVAAAQAVFDAAVAARDRLGPFYPRPAGLGPTDSEALAQAEVEMAEEALYRAKNSEFELSAQDMCSTVALMTRYGMIDQAVDEPAWPDPGDFGLSSAEANPAHDVDVSIGDLPVRLHRYRAALDAIVDRVSDVPAGIPEYKLSSNSGWLVTSGEITVALDAGGADVRDAHPDVVWWRDWIDWLEYARARGGFRVY
ncbi:hypothetical protein [Nocardia nova]|uniref:hypothetical protein n=1 Tax=Nocardia nova TaxID=37330 RepID=UPI0033E4F25F